MRKLVVIFSVFLLEFSFDIHAEQPDNANIVVNDDINTAFSIIREGRFWPEDALLRRLGKGYESQKLKPFLSKKWQRKVLVIVRGRPKAVAKVADGYGGYPFRPTEVLFFANSRYIDLEYYLVLYYPLSSLEALDVEEKGDGLSVFALREDGVKKERLFVTYETLVGPDLYQDQKFWEKVNKPVRLGSRVQK